MAYEFKRLSEVEALTEVPEGANALIEIDGVVKRVPGSGLGGATGIKTAIIKDSGYDNALAGVMATDAVEPSFTYECINMTFDEAYQTMASGEPLSIFGMFTDNNTPINVRGITMFGGTMMGVPCLGMTFELMNDSIMLYWTADGISTESPAPVE